MKPSALKWVATSALIYIIRKMYFKALKQKGKHQLSRVSRCYVSTAILIIALAFLSTCGLDIDYLFFVDADPPSEFEVAVANSGTVSVCGGNNDITIAITALKEDGTTDTRYRRAGKLFLIGAEDESLPFTPTKTPHFSDGKVTLSGVSLPTERPGDYVIRCVDENDKTISGTSDSFRLEVLRVDYFDVSGLPSLIYSGSSYGLTVRAIDQNGDEFTEFDAYVDMQVTEGYTMSPATLKLNAGSANGSFVITGSGPLTVSARLSADQGDDVTCTGGLQTGEGGDPGTNGGDPGGNGGDPGGNGGEDDGGETGESAEPTNLECTLTGPTADVLKGTSFAMNLSVTKTDQTGGSFPSFSGSAGYTPTDIGLDPLTHGVSTFNANYQFTVSTTGDHTITATVTDNDSSLPPCSCSASVRVVEGIAIYGDYAADLKAKLETRLPGKQFFIVNSLSSLDVITPYTALIVNLAGSGYAIARGDLTAAEATVIKAYYDTLSPILIAHDNMETGPGTAETILAAPIWGVSEIIEIDFRVAQNTYIPNPSPPISIPGTPEFLQEVFINGYTYSGSTPIVSMEYSGPTYALILAQTVGTKAVLMGEAIWHPFGGDEDLETQWWDGAVNQDIVVNLINWMLIP